jgi:integrase
MKLVNIMTNDGGHIGKSTNTSTFPTNVTRSMQTELRYMYLAKQKLKDYSSELNLNWKDDPLDFCHWLIQQKSIRQWEKNTWRQYKAACIFFMKNNGPKECVELLENEDSEGCVKKRGEDRRGASLKKKKLPRDDLAKILKYLSKESKIKKWDRILALWLVSAVSTGLRPSEWEHATLSGTTLRVKNGKNSNGRSNGEYRHLKLDNIPVDHLKAIRTFVALIKKVDYTQAYEACRYRLRYVCRDIWPRRQSITSLYAARHQFKANASASGLLLNEIAALMGHASDETATIHYGKKVVGDEKASLPTPLEEEVSTVKTVAKQFTPKKEDAPIKV